MVLPKMAKCVLTLCNSNADVERLNEETITGLRPNKAAVEECGGVNKVSTT